MERVTDNTLVKRILRGEVEAYRTIVMRHQAKVFYLGLKFFRDRHDAEDFAQEVFLRAFEKLSMFQGEVPFGSWLYRVAYNLAVNQYHKRRRSRLEVPLPAEPRDLALTPESRALRNETLERVRKVLKKIPEIYGQIIRMHFFEGLSYPEISRILSIPVNTIKSHMFRAKQMLRLRLGSYMLSYLEEGVL